MWNEAPESTTQSIREGRGWRRHDVRGEGQGRCSDMATRRGGGGRGLNCQGGDYCTREDKGSRHVTVGLGVEVAAVTKDRAHGGIEAHAGAPDELAIVEKDAHSHPDGNGRRQEVAPTARAKARPW